MDRGGHRVPKGWTRLKQLSMHTHMQLIRYRNFLQGHGFLSDEKYSFHSMIPISAMIMFLSKTFLFLNFFLIHISLKMVPLLYLL